MRFHLNRTPSRHAGDDSLPNQSDAGPADDQRPYRLRSDGESVASPGSTDDRGDAAREAVSDVNETSPQLWIGHGARTDHLLAWAAELAEQDVVLKKPVSFVEAPLRRVTTDRASDHANRYLRVVAAARIRQESGGHPPYTGSWWQERADEAMGALAAMREAMVGAEQHHIDSEESNDE